MVNVEIGWKRKKKVRGTDRQLKWSNAGKADPANNPHIAHIYEVPIFHQEHEGYIRNTGSAAGHEA
jgi:hypothetical protein